MKIKRFEAPNMPEALRMVRKEFGAEAVILSAKNVKKPGNLFGLKSGGLVCSRGVPAETLHAQRLA